jgi:hypothetical protein
MEALRLTLVFFHLVGLSVLLGGFFTQLRLDERRVTFPLLAGALTQLVTGVSLVAVRRSEDLAVNDAKIGTKLAVVLVITALAVVGWRQRKARPGPFVAVGVLTAVNLAIAVFWT